MLFNVQLIQLLLGRKGMGSLKPIVYWCTFQYERWKFQIAATEKGLCFVGSQNGGYEELTAFVAKKLPGFVCINDEEKLKSYRQEFSRYFKLESKEFEMPIDLYGTDFQKEVWAALLKVRYGETATYSEIAKLIHRPSAVRAVASAIGANPVMIVVPCHRILGKNGKLTGFRGGLEMKEKLLKHEMQTEDFSRKAANK